MKNEGVQAAERTREYAGIGIVPLAIVSYHGLKDYCLGGEQNRIKDDFNYIKSQSMRNNLILGNIPEELGEKPAETEHLFKKLMVGKLIMAQDVADNLILERGQGVGLWSK
ncbi:hypothetical protein MAR_036380 [Mya arenaria]|uniref:Uncharacterized protein n=1 Tax=Mya arenaria TaxID=6604 RepID=A0ABY7FP79_MYAAR|nr:hypothetical protein MAR_036380 [Mya arenaria]